MPNLLIECGNENCHTLLLAQVEKSGELACYLREMDWWPLATEKPNLTTWLCPVCGKRWRSTTGHPLPSETPKPDWPSQ